MRAGFEGVREEINGHAADSHLPHCSPESSEEDEEEEEESAAVEREERERPAGRALSLFAWAQNSSRTKLCVWFERGGRRHETLRDPTTPTTPNPSSPKDPTVQPT